MHADQIGPALRILEDVRDAIESYAIEPEKRPLPDLSYEGAVARQARGQRLIDGIRTLDTGSLPGALRLALGVAEARAGSWATAADWYWTVFDPIDSDLYGPFAATPYCGGMAVTMASRGLRQIDLADDAGRHRYLAGLYDLAAMLGSFAARTQGQTERGILMPRAQAAKAANLLARIHGEQCTVLAVDDARLPGHEAFKSAVRNVLADQIGAAFEALTLLFDNDYLSRAPEAVGLSNLPEGDSIYAKLVRKHGSTDLTPRQVHDLGLERMADVRRDMAAARRDYGFVGDDLAFRAHLDADPAWRANSAEAVAAVFQRYIDRFEAKFDGLFSARPRATYGVSPLPEAMSEAMTFGYYQPSSPEQPHGSYVFNAANLTRSGLFNLGPLTYHELVPGHHLQLALQSENPALDFVRRHSRNTAFIEGWAEYAATLAGECGLYELPAERFGRAVSEAFLVSRLVVDTGMNALGWSLEQARDYMRENSFVMEREIGSETLRYACDIPGQALSYKLGEYAMHEMRRRMAEALGGRFELRRFHDAVLAAGTLPLPLLRAHLDEVTADLAAAGTVHA